MLGNESIYFSMNVLRAYHVPGGKETAPELEQLRRERCTMQEWQGHATRAAVQCSKIPEEMKKNHYLGQLEEGVMGKGAIFLGFEGGRMFPRCSAGTGGRAWPCKGPGASDGFASSGGSEHFLELSARLWGEEIAWGLLLGKAAGAWQINTVLMVSHEASSLSYRVLFKTVFNFIIYLTIDSKWLPKGIIVSSKHLCVPDI